MTDLKPSTPPKPEDAELSKALQDLKNAERDLEAAHAAETRAEHEVDEAVKEIEQAEQSSEHWIVVNGDRKVLHTKHVSFEEIVKVAYPVSPPGTDVQFTVQFSRGPESRPTGTLIEGQSTKIRNGMEFDVTPTNRS